MEVQDLYQNQAQRLLHTSTSSIALPALSNFLRLNCGKSAEKTREFLLCLLEHSPSNINFEAFCSLVRVLKSHVQPLQEEGLLELLTQLVSSSALFYFPSLKHIKPAPFKKLLVLLKGLPLREPESIDDHMQTLLFISQESYSAQFAEKLVEKINNEVLVERKSQSPKNLKVNCFFGPFVVRHIDGLVPQLHRLLVRNQANLQVWDDFFTAIADLSGIDKTAIALLAKIKSLYLSQTEICTRIITSVTSHLREEKFLREVVGFLTILVSGEHNPKRKIAYIRMLEGSLKSLKGIPEGARNLIAQDIAVVVANSIIKFTEEEEFGTLVTVIDTLAGFISEPKDDIAKALRPYLKNQNKFILILTGLMITRIYRKEHTNVLPSLKEVHAHFKAIIPNSMKKAGTNWQWLLPVVDFLAENDPAAIDFLGQNLPIFKGSCLALTSLEMKVGLSLIVKKIAFLKTEQEDVEDYLFAIAALLLEETKHGATWTSFLESLTSQEKVRLITRGIFPLAVFGCQDIKKNKGNSFSSLLACIVKQLKGQKVEIESSEDFARLVICLGKDKKTMDECFVLKDKDGFRQLQQRWIKASLFDCSSEDNTINSYQKETIDSVTRSLLKYSQEYLLDLFKLFSTLSFYKEDLSFLQDFSKQCLESTGQAKAQMQEWMADLLERQVLKEKVCKPKRVYIGVTLEVKMMSEEEVKEEKYRQHFAKMVRVFDLVAEHFLATFNNHQLLVTLWQDLMQPLLSTTIYPEHRLNIHRLVKQSCLYTAEFNHKEKESNLFQKHALFLGQFFSLRDSGLTPSVKLMKHCGTFLKELLAYPFEEGQGFHILIDQKEQFVMLLVNDMCGVLLNNMEFDVNLKKQAIRFYEKCFKSGLDFHNDDSLFTSITLNINIMSNCQSIQAVLLHVLRRINQNKFKELFEDILNFIQPTKKLILETLSMLDHSYRPEFEEFIKIKILALESNAEISKLATDSISADVELKKSILSFNMKNFVKKNSKETIEKLCLFIREEITPQSAEAVFKMVLKASEELFDEEFDQEGLEMLPFFLQLNIDHIGETLFKPVFSLLTTKFTSKEEFGTLTKLCVQVGINIIKRNAQKHSEKLLLVLESFISKASGVSNIIFLGVLAPYLQGNKNLQIIEQRITELFRSDREADQRSISKCMSDLMSFFKKPEDLVEQIFLNIGTLDEQLQVGQSYLFSGLLKGIGFSHTQIYIDKIISSDYVTKTRSEKFGRINLIQAMVENFGRVIEIKSIDIISIILSYMADSLEDVRNLARKTGQNLILRMSSFSVKVLLPQLLEGLENEQNWRIKISYIWILGVMANSSAKQLQTSLPIIVPSLSACLSNAHPTIREKSSEALNLIGQTIKNPEISMCVDILIEALEDPFENSSKAIDLLLKTKFHHYIDPPSLSMVIPILDYCMRGRNSDHKAGACQVMGSIVELISNPYDLLPYLRIILAGLKVSLCDPLPEIRRIASMAIGKISAKIGTKNAEEYFRFVSDIIESSTSTSIERQGAAQAHAEVICSQTYEYFEESLYRIFEQLNSARHSEKEGYILVFLFVPMIRTQEFEGFIKEVNENMYCFVSDEDEVVRNAAMLVEKVLINNYCLSHTDLLLQPLCDGAFDPNWKRRNAAVILIGEILNIIKSHMYNTRSTDKAYAYYRGLMAVYIIKDDELEMSRATAIQVWNTYIENTPKTIRAGIVELVKMWTKWTHATGGVVFKNIVAFSTKYGETYFSEILEFIPQYLSEPEHQVGVFEVLAQFVKRLSKDFLSRGSFREIITSLFSDNLFVIEERVRPALAKCLAIYIDKMQEEKYFEELLYPTISRMDETEESSQEYTYNMHLLKDLLNTNSHKVVDRVTSKVMSPPMSEFKIEVITNNAEKLANHLYSSFHRPATELLLEEVLSLVGNPQKESRRNLIIYCLQQVSLQLSPRYKIQFIRMVISHISREMEAYSASSSNPVGKQTLEILIEMVMFFLNSTPLEDIEDLDIIVGKMSPLIFMGEPGLSAIGHRIYLLVITDHKSFRTSEYVRQIRVSFENKVARNEMVWTDKDILRDYISILVKGVAYGREEVMEESLHLLEFILEHTPRSLLEKEVLRIAGPIIRICNYPLLLKQKVRAMELLTLIARLKFKLEVYNVQLMSVCVRLLQEFQASEDAIYTVVDTYFAMLSNTVLKKEIVLSLMGRLKHFNPNFVQTIFHLVKKITKEGLDLPKNLVEKMHEDITSLVIHYCDRLTVKALYYASKASARLAILLNKPIEKIESQLRGLTVPYELLLNYLHNAYYRKSKVAKMEVMEVFVRECSREKVFYLLHSLHLCTRDSEEMRREFSQEYIKRLVPENISGFEQISQIVEEFESDAPEELEEAQAEINQT